MTYPKIQGIHEGIYTALKGHLFSLIGVPIQIDLPKVTGMPLQIDQLQPLCLPTASYIYLFIGVIRVYI